MEKKIFFFFSLLLLVLQVIPQPVHAASDSRPLQLTAAERQWLAEHPVIRVAPDPDFPPLEALHGQGEFTGIYISFLRMFEQKMPIRFELVALENWTEVLEQARNRTIDMTGAACTTPDREQYLRFTTPFVEIPAVVIVRDSMKTIPSMQALKGLKVAVVANYAEHEFMAANYPEVELAVMPGIVSGLRAVSFGHVDAMILNLASATYYIEKEGIANLRTSIDSGFHYQLAFPSRSDWPQLNALLQQALDSITPEEKETIIGRWLGLKPSPWRPDRATVAALAIVLAALVFMAVLLWNMTLHRKVEQRTAALEQELHERVKAQKNLLESRKKFQTLFESVNDAVFVNHPVGDNRPGNFVEVNSNGCKLLGYSRDELLAMAPDDFIVAEEAGRIPALLQQLREKGQSLYELTLLNRDGEKIPVEISARFFELEGVPTIISTVRDISDRRHTEEEQLKVRKLESIGVLAGGIAHDFNNILAAIAGNINVASHILGKDSKVSGMLAAAEKATLRARDLTQQLLTFSRGGAPVRETADIAEIIRDSADFVLHGSNVACRYELPGNLWLTRIDKGQISQVIQNIVINAGHAMPQGGIVTITAENVELEAGSRVPLGPGKYIRLDMRDTGIGIAADHLPRIFDPYFTTKDKDSRKGSGLGLAVAHSIITRHGGTITVASEPNRGTTFTIYLPALVAEHQAPLPRQEEASRHGQGRILVMDDEENVREVATKMLMHLGYEVECAEDGEQAIRRYQEAIVGGRPFDLVMMDLTIPGGMGGKEAVQQILKIDPEAKVIVSSGYANDPVLADFRRYGFLGVVSKPYLLVVLSRAVEEALQGREVRGEERGT
jgi:PAS domain S-box-containing protein